MGFRRYRGTVDTVATAALDHRVLTITCQRCSRSRNIWAYKVQANWPERAKVIPLNRTTSGFYCSGCKRSVEVYITSQPEGEF